MGLGEFGDGAGTFGGGRAGFGEVGGTGTVHLQLDTGGHHREEGSCDVEDGGAWPVSGGDDQQESVGPIEACVHLDVAAGDPRGSTAELPGGQSTADAVEFGDRDAVHDHRIAGDLAGSARAFAGEDDQRAVRDQLGEQHREALRDLRKRPHQHVAQVGDEGIGAWYSGGHPGHTIRAPDMQGKRRLNSPARGPHRSGSP